jgi:excinuclease UvrABC nuclease subunit
MHQLKDKGFIVLNDGPSGVYALCCHGDVVYIGHSTNVYKRVRQHYNSKAWYWDQVFVLWCDADQLLLLEAQLIQELKPRHNTKTPDPAVHSRPRIDLTRLLHIPVPIERRRG